MYLARFMSSGKITYTVRQSVKEKGVYTSRTLFDLGPNPGSYIVYPGGNSFYVQEELVETVEERGQEVDPNELDDLMWPFVDATIRRKLRGFKDRADSRKRPKPLGEMEKEFIHNHLHIIDKRRMNYLRLGTLDQSRVGVVPPQLYRPLLHASRDEIEQHFLRMEWELRPNARAMYVYSFLHLRRFFSEICAGSMPQGLDQEKLDQFFLREICALNADSDFWSPEEPSSFLHPYLIRYAIMFFDHPFGPTPFLDQIIQDFIARHRFHHPPPKKQDISRDEMSTLFEVPRETLMSMSARQITRRYRRVAKKHHPDQGGNQDTFVRLHQAYTWLLKQAKNRKR